MTVNASWARAWLEQSVAVIADNRAELIRLDREIGDGDHGENMDRGFQAVLPKIQDAAGDATPADLLKLVATTLISTVGGAAGPLYGTAFLKASGAVAEKTELDASDIVSLLTAARDGIVLRGKAESGDKTMVDAWTPAVEAAERSAADGDSAADALAAAAAAAEQGAEATEPLVAHKGRASYLGERAVGHRDPGAQSTALILRVAANAAQESA